MNPGTLGEWTGERWAPIHDDEFTRRVNHILATHMAAALADPDLGHTPEGDARRIYGHLRESGLEPRQANGIGMALAASRKETAKGIAGYLLERLGNQEPGTV